MLLIIYVERLLHIGSHFSLRKWRRRPHFPTKLAAVALFSYKIGGGGLIFQQNWLRQQGFDNITGGCSDMVWILAVDERRKTKTKENNGLLQRKKQAIELTHE